MIDATREAPIPPQLRSRLAAVIGHYEIQQDEDCLHLNIWVPQERSAKAPVFVFIHGGAFLTGGGSLPCYDGRLLAEQTGMVVVTISYRLGVLGFLPIQGIAPPNLGLHDQIAALRWIRNTISAFGGDADCITVAGQSAGAYSIALLLAHSVGRELFDRAIMMSAPLGLSLPTAASSVGIAREYLAEMGIAPGAVRAMRKVSLQELLRVQADMQRRSASTPGEIAPTFLPVIDGDLVVEDPINAFARGDAAWCDIIVGTTREEMAAFYVGDEALDRVAADVLQAAFMKRYGGRADDALRKARAIRSSRKTDFDSG